MAEVNLANLKAVREFFEMTTSVFTEEWKTLSDEDKDFFRREVGKMQS
jgi:hypothetical protein